MAAHVSIEISDWTTAKSANSRASLCPPREVGQGPQTPPSTKGGRLSTKLPRAGRQLHVLDVENLMGGTHFTAAEVSRLRTRYTTLISVAPMAQVVVGASAGQSALAAGVGWTGAGLRMRFGRDGADLALLALLEREKVADRFEEVFIASGDGIFAPVAAQLAAQGAMVTVVSRREALARVLRLAAHRVIHLDGPRPDCARHELGAGSREAGHTTPAA